MTYEESISEQRRKLNERISLYQMMQRLGDLSAAEMARILDEAAEEVRLLDDLEQPVESDSA